VLVSMASVGAVHYMETTAFCGQVCHTNMEPQYVGHQNGAHARVQCVACYVGPRVGALVQSNMAGTRQLWQLASGRVPEAVPSPVQAMRPARFTFENCHVPERFHGNEVRVFRDYADDEQNTETATTMTLFVGGGNAAAGVGSGIHWHMNLDNAAGGSDRAHDPADTNAAAADVSELNRGTVDLSYVLTSRMSVGRVLLVRAVPRARLHPGR
jgi:hypothetical protein